MWRDAGASYGFLKFSVDEADGRVNDNLALYVPNAAGNLAEQPREAGGLILPLVQIDASVDGRTLSTLPGGFNQTVISWSPELNYNVLTTPARNIFDVIPSAGNVVMAMYALNNGNADVEPDVRFYDVTLSKEAATEVPAAIATEIPLLSPTDSPTLGATDASSNSPPTQVPTPTATDPANNTPQASTPETSAPANTGTDLPTINTTISNNLNETARPEINGNETEVPVVEMPVEAPLNGTGNIFDHSGITDDGMVTDDSKESKDEDQTAAPSTVASENANSGACTRGRLLTFTLAALCTLL